MPEQRTSTSVQLRERIDRYLDDSGLAGPNPRVVPLTGDASDRRYFRVIPADGPSIVLALHAGPIDFASLPFASVAELLQPIPLPVPAILGHSRRARHPGAAGSRRRDAAGAPRRGVGRPSMLRCIARRWRSSSSCSAAAPISRPIAIRRIAVAFDVEKLTWELEFFATYFVQGYRGVALGSPRARRRSPRSGQSIVEELAAEPRVLCHRDYHSRNLMLRDGSLYIIDFQDARMGPDTYDLVSLLRDSYVDITDRELDELIAYFLALKRSDDRAHVRRRVPAPVRSDGAAAQPQGARHVRLPDRDAPQHRLHPVHAAHAALRPHQPRDATRASRACATCSATHIEELA